MGVSGGLSLEDFRLVPCEGFEDSSIRTSQAMAWFQDHLFVGTGRGPLRPMGLSPEALEEYPVLARLAARRRSRRTREQEAGAQIWRFDPRTDTWEQVYESPWVIGLDGSECPRDRSVRARAVYQGTSDASPALYMGIGSMEGQVVIVRSGDGDSFEETDHDGLGLGDADIPSIRTLCEWRSVLHTTPVGKNHDRGLLDDIRTDHPIVFASADPARGSWRPVSDPGFGDEENLSIDEMAVFAGCLYAGTHNPAQGFQIWKASARPARGRYKWRKIITDGAYRGPESSVPVGMQAFGDALYVGSGLEEQGMGETFASGPFGAEILRIHPDDRWDLLVGSARDTPDGPKVPLSGSGPGFDDEFVQGYRRLVEHDGWLYAGGSDWRFAPTYLPRRGHERPDLSPSRERYLRARTEEWEGGFGFWRSRDGLEWTAITTDGFDDNPYTYAIRELVPTPHGLFVATIANRSSQFGGGLRVWVGRP